MKIKAVIFDMDGTVVENSYDWPRIKAELGTGDLPILAYLNGLDEPERSAKWKILRKHEDKQTRSSVLKKGMAEILELLGERGVRTALVTNNSRTNARRLLKKFGLRFDAVLTREDGLWKPSGAPLTRVMEMLGFGPDECCVVGDTLFDVWAAQDAGIEKIFILHSDSSRFAMTPAEVVPSAEALWEKVRLLLE